MGTHSMHKRYQHVPDLLPLVGRGDLRQVYPNKSWDYRIYKCFTGRSMIRAHYIIWIIMAICFIIGGALYRGNQDIAMQRRVDAARIEGAAVMLNSMTVKQLSDLEI
jgi:hypothetical protein